MYNELRPGRKLEKIEFIENGNKKITFLKKIRLLEARKI